MAARPHPPHRNPLHEPFDSAQGRHGEGTELGEGTNTGTRTETEDTILGGRLRIIQPRRGYRFSVDSILLADFAAPRRHHRVLELGAGCGVISVMLAATRHPREVVALELQPTLVEMIRRN